MERSHIGPVLDAWRTLVRSGHLQSIESVLEAVYDAEHRVEVAEKHVQVMEQTRHALETQIAELTKARDDFTTHYHRTRTELARKLQEAQKEHAQVMAMMDHSRAEAERTTSDALRAKGNALQEAHQADQRLIGLRGELGQWVKRQQDLAAEVRQLESNRDAATREIESIRSRITALVGLANS